MEFTAPTAWRILNPASRFTAFTTSWQSSNAPSIATLNTFASCSEYICARWNGLMRPLGESMKTFTRALPRSACSAALPVSPLVAPSTLRRRPCRSSTASKRLPRSCIATSLKASVGPFESRRRCRLGSSVWSGVISGVPKACAVYVRSTSDFSSPPGKSSAKKRSTSKVSRGHCSGTMSPPSGARPSSRMSVNPCEAAWPRVLTYFIAGKRGRIPFFAGRRSALPLEKWDLAPFSSQQLLEPDAHHLRRNRRQRLDPAHRLVHAPLGRHVGEDHDVHLVLALRRLLLEDRVDRDREIGADARHVGEHAGPVERAQPQVVAGLHVLHRQDRLALQAIG